MAAVAQYAGQTTAPSWSASSAPPRAVQHRYVELHTGVRLHYVELPSVAGAPFRGTALLVHGFPDTWFGWRKQIHAIAGCGYHVIVPDQRGYGDTSAPQSAAAYAMPHTCADMVALMDALLLPSVVLFGHDWGGTLVWNMAQQFPERVSHVCAVCTPFLPQPEADPWPKMQAKPGRFDYQIWFQSEAAQREFEADHVRSLRGFMRGHDDMPPVRDPKLLRQPPTVRKGMFVALKSDIPRASMLTAGEEAHYAAQFRRSGYFGPLSWYRNVTRNWEWMKPTRGRKVVQDCLMITAAHDATLTPAMAQKYMPGNVPRCRYENVDAAGHWVLQERPTEVNRHITSWLHSIKPEQHAPLSVPAGPSAAKL